jgi:hypothetical protein
MTVHSFDILIIGDEVESILTAVSAYRASNELNHPTSIGLIRHNAPKDSLLGGLSTRGGLSYMDITLEHIPPLFGEFLCRADVTRIGLCPKKAHDSLTAMLVETDITVLNEDVTHAQQIDNNRWTLTLNKGDTVKSTIILDTTPDADIARLAGAKYTEGLGHFMQKPVPDFPNTLGVSAVFTLHHLPRKTLIDIEEQLRKHPDSKAYLTKALPYKTKADIEELLTRPVFSPDDNDYVDILNPLIGVHFHAWREQPLSDYLDTAIHVDGFNTSRLPEYCLTTGAENGEYFGMNGMVMKLPDTNTQIKLSQGKQPIPKLMAETIEQFRQFLIEHGAPESTSVTLPQQAYVRQTVNIHSDNMLSAQQLFSGGVNAEDAIGTFSYWVDLRGIQWCEFFPNEAELPKPVFNVGIAQCFPKPTSDKHFNNLAVISRSAGYGPIAQGPCRIIQHQAMVGEAMAILAVAAIQQGNLLHTSSLQPVQQVLHQRYKKTGHQQMPTVGQQTFSPSECNDHPLIRGENNFLDTL